MKRLRVRRRYVWIVAGLAAAHLLFPRYVVATGSMEPGVPAGSYVLACRIAYWFSEPAKGDIVVFAPARPICEYPWIHRIVALPGASIAEASRGRAKASRSDIGLSPTVAATVPPGYLYQSGDSAKSYHGLVPRRQVMARVLFHFPLPWRHEEI